MDTDGGAGVLDGDVERVLRAVARVEERLDAIEQIAADRPARDDEMLGATLHRLIEEVASFATDVEATLGELTGLATDLTSRLGRLEDRLSARDTAGARLADAVAAVDRKVTAAAEDHSTRINKFVAALHADKQTRSEWEEQLAAAIAATATSLQTAIERSRDDAAPAVVAHLSEHVTTTVTATVAAAVDELHRELGEMARATQAATAELLGELAAAPPPPPPPPPPPGEPPPAPPDLTPAIDALRTELENAERQRAADVSAVHAKLDAAQAALPDQLAVHVERVRGVVLPAVTPVRERLDTVAAAVAKLDEQVRAALEPHPDRPDLPDLLDVQLTVLREELAAFEQRRIPPALPQQVNLSPIHREMEALREELLSALRLVIRSVEGTGGSAADRAQLAATAGQLAAALPVVVDELAQMRLSVDYIRTLLV